MSTPSDEAIIIVSGLPRSGTSMMMQMLAAGGVPILADAVRAADEDNPQGYYEFEPVKRTKDDSSWVAAASGKAVKAVYALLQDLPANRTYRIIFMQRPIEEVVASQQAMLARTGRQGANADATALADVFRRESARIEQWLAAQPHISVLYVNYHDVLQDAPAQCRAVAEFLGIDLDLDAMQACVQPALYRHKAPTPTPASGATSRKTRIVAAVAAVVILVVALILLGPFHGADPNGDGNATTPPLHDDPYENPDDDAFEAVEDIPYAAGRAPRQPASTSQPASRPAADPDDTLLDEQQLERLRSLPYTR